MGWDGWTVDPLWLVSHGARAVQLSQKAPSACYSLFLTGTEGIKEPLYQSNLPVWLQPLNAFSWWKLWKLIISSRRVQNAFYQNYTTWPVKKSKRFWTALEWSYECKTEGWKVPLLTFMYQWFNSVLNLIFFKASGSEIRKVTSSFYLIQDGSVTISGEKNITKLSLQPGIWADKQWYNLRLFGMGG